jgi:hypothetical protein
VGLFVCWLLFGWFVVCSVDSLVGYLFGRSVSFVFGGLVFCYVVVVWLVVVCYFGWLTVKFCFV